MLLCASSYEWILHHQLPHIIIRWWLLLRWRPHLLLLLLLHLLLHHHLLLLLPISRPFALRKLKLCSVLLLVLCFSWLFEITIVIVLLFFPEFLFFLFITLIF